VGVLLASYTLFKSGHRLGTIENELKNLRNEMDRQREEVGKLIEKYTNLAIDLRSEIARRETSDSHRNEVKK
jgi:hypothetical protein